jgi:hypothetical protein
MAKKKRKPELPGGYLALYNRVLNDARFKALPCYCQMIYIKALQKSMFATHNGDGTFTLTPGDFKNMSSSTFRRNVKKLIDLGWLRIKEHGGLYRNANKYTATPLGDIFLKKYNRPWGGNIKEPLQDESEKNSIPIGNN